MSCPVPKSKIMIKPQPFEAYVFSDIPVGSFFNFLDVSKNSNFVCLKLSDTKFIEIYDGGCINEYTDSHTENFIYKILDATFTYNEEN